VRGKASDGADRSAEMSYVAEQIAKQESAMHEYQQALMAMGAQQMEKDRKRIETLEARIKRAKDYCAEQTDGDCQFDSTLAWIVAILEGQI
jgi:aconitase B